MTPFDGEGLDGFTVVHGPNERGKTLLIDAIVRLLFKKTLKPALRRSFGDRARNIERVDEEPEGFIVLTGEGAEHKLGRDQSLQEVFPVPLTPEDFRHVFVVRDSDLTVHEEDEYYEKENETLTGLRTSEIEKVLEALRRRGRLRSLSPDSPLANNADTDPPHAARRVETARQLVVRMRAAASALRADGFDTLADEMQRLHERRQQLDDERRRLVAARDREQARSALGIVEEIKNLTRLLAETRAPEEKELRRWQRLQAEAKQGARALAAERERVARTTGSIDAERDRLETDRRALEAARARVDRIDASLRPARETFESDRMLHRRRRTQSTPLVLTAVVAGVATLGGAGVFLALGHVAGAVAAGAGAVLAAVALVQLWRISAEGRALEARAAGLCESAREHGIGVDRVLDLRSAIEDTERECEVLADALRKREAQLGSLAAEFDNARAMVSDMEKRMASSDADVRALQKRTGAASIEALETALRNRRETEATRQGRVRALETLIPMPSDAADPVSAAESEIRHRLEATAEHGGLAHDPDRSGEVERELVQVREQEQHAAGQRRNGERELDELRVLAAEPGVIDDVAPCRTTVELEHLAARLEQWCAHIETEGTAARRAVSMFHEIELEEREKVGALFGEDSPVSEVFSRVTGERYRAVHFEPEASRVMVETGEGLRLPATALSGGAFDQLYLAVRLAIASRLLGDARGFFLLDDPFIKADRQRLRRLIDTLVSLAEDGWQFLYFTAKDEVVDALRPSIEAGQVTLLALDAPPVPRAARTRPEGRPAAPADNGQQRLEL